MSGKVPPSSRAGRRGRSLASHPSAAVRRAADLRERFTGHETEIIGEVTLPPHPEAVAIIGELTAICYSTVRDGKHEEYIHEFRKADRALLCTSPDGRQLYIIGGRYDFTELGIVDASDRKHSPRYRRGRAR